MKKIGSEIVKEETLKVKVTSETLSDLLSLIKEKGWEVEEGFRIILGAGYGYLFAKPILNDGNQAGFPQNTEQLVERLVKAEARLGSMRYRAYEIQQANSSWELSAGAVHKENTGLRNIAKRRLEEVDDLRIKVIKLTEENADLRKKVNEYEGRINQPRISKNLFLKLMARIKKT